MLASGEPQLSLGGQVGAGVVSVVPVFEGLALKHAILQQEVNRAAVYDSLRADYFNLAAVWR